MNLDFDGSELSTADTFNEAVLPTLPRFAYLRTLSKADIEEAKQRADHLAALQALSDASRCRLSRFNGFVSWAVFQRSEFAANPAFAPDVRSMIERYSRRYGYAR